MSEPAQVAIAGAGIIGLATALALCRRGLQVTVLEAETAMKEASWSAGGMLAVEDPGNPAALLPLSRYSRSLYPSFLEELAYLSGLCVPLRTQQTVQALAYSGELASGPALTAEAAQQLVPGLRDAGRTYVLLEEASLDPRDLCIALPAAARAAGVTIHEQQGVLSAANENGVICLTTTCGTVRADAFVNCCGAWTTSLDASLEVTPRKGQMMVVAQPEGPTLTRVLRSEEIYLIPRGDGRIAVGATVEDAGYSRHVDPHALASLRTLAAELWPPILHAPVIESWAGLRPATVDGLPVIGKYGEHDAQQDSTRLLVASGHYRNGILLAPGTAELIADLVCHRTPAIDLAPFAPHRPSLSATGSVCDKHFVAAL